MGQWKGPIALNLTSQNFGKFGLQTIHKIKFRTRPEGQMPHPNNQEIIMKITSNWQNYFFAASQQIMMDSFVKVCWMKTSANFPQEIKFNGAIEGELFKKSEIMGQW